MQAVCQGSRSVIKKISKPLSGLKLSNPLSCLQPHCINCHGDQRWVRISSPISCRFFHTPLTCERYPEIKRGDYAQLTDADVGVFERLLSPECVLKDEDTLTAYNTDWLRTCKGKSTLVLRPRTTEQVSTVLRYCNEHNLAVVPQGGNTGLVGGSVPVFDEIILSTQLMNTVNHLDPIAGVLSCQSGCILADLEEFVNQSNMVVPLDLGAKGSCHIGGNVSTNAGGIRLLRYGSLHGSVLGVEAVLANGQVLDCLNILRKDNTGYDLKQLFIGSEGSLGIVTAVSLFCPQRASAVNVVLLACDSFQSVLDIFQQCKSRLAEILSAVEYFDSACTELLQEHMGLISPLASSPFYVLIETMGSHAGHDEEKLTSLMEDLMQSGIVTNGTMATDNTKINALWALREKISEGLMYDGYVYKYDISLPPQYYYKAVEASCEKFENRVKRIVSYGHVADGNLHLNLTTPQFEADLASDINGFLYNWVSEHQGSISAEHGIGLQKRNYLHLCKSKPSVDLMAQLKGFMDPKRILNPYKVLPAHIWNDTY